MSQNRSRPKRKTAAQVGREQADRAAAAIRQQEGVRCPQCGCRFNPEADLAVAEDLDELQATAHRLQPTAAKLAAQIASRVDATTFDLWVGPLVLIGATTQALRFAGPPHLVRWARDRCTPLLQAVATDLAGHPLTVYWATTNAELHPNLADALEAAGHTPPAT